jgi:hypothetical protein
MSIKSVTKEIAYADLNIDEAIELLQEVKRKKDLFTGIGREINDIRKPSWVLAISRREMMSVDLPVINPNPTNPQ